MSMPEGSVVSSVHVGDPVLLLLLLLLRLP